MYSCSTDSCFVIHSHSLFILYLLSVLTMIFHTSGVQVCVVVNCSLKLLLSFHSSLVIRSGGSSDVRLIEEDREEQQVTQIHDRSTHDVVCV